MLRARAYLQESVQKSKKQESNDNAWERTWADEKQKCYLLVVMS